MTDALELFRAPPGETIPIFDETWGREVMSGILLPFPLEAIDRPALLSIRYDTEGCVSERGGVREDYVECPCHPRWTDWENCRCEGLHVCDNWKEMT